MPLGPFSSSHVWLPLTYASRGSPSLVSSAAMSSALVRHTHVGVTGAQVRCGRGDGSSPRPSDDYGVGTQETQPWPLDVLAAPPPMVTLSSQTPPGLANPPAPTVCLVNPPPATSVTLVTKA